jgi:hypothetical protein
MSAGYPDGCTQSTHDAAFGELSEAPGVDVVRLDCGHWDTEDHGEPVGGKLICIKCFEAREKLIREAIGGKP